MEKITITKHEFAQNFGGMGFHNNDAMLYHIIDKEHFNQVICKDYREISPGFMRTLGGFSDWTRDAMDWFAEYYDQMQKWTDTPIYLTAACGKVHFSEEEMEKYADDVAERLSYLYYEKNVRHLRYYCFSNEMSRGMWGVLRTDLPLFKKYHEKLYSAFQKYNLPIGLLATDASGYDWWNTVDWAIENMSDITEDYCVHIYERAERYDIFNVDFYDFFYEKCKEISDKAIRNFGKRVILGEVGIQDGFQDYNGAAVIDYCKYFRDPYEQAYCGLMLAEMAFAAINAGIFAIAYWSYTDYPSPISCAYSTSDDEYLRRWGEAERFFSGTTDTKYNKFGFLKWEDDGDYYPRFHYFCIAPLIKLFKKNSKVLDIELNNPMLRCCGILNRDGSVSIGIVNRSKKSTKIMLDCKLFKQNVRVYEYDPYNVAYNKFGDLQEHSAVLDASCCEYELKPESVTYFTTDYKKKAHSVYAQNLKISGKVLMWDKVEEKDHCYYRIYASKQKEFVPAYENQIASTIAEELPISDPTLYYKVLSVDKSGNV